MEEIHTTSLNHHAYALMECHVWIALNFAFNLMKFRKKFPSMYKMDEKPDCPKLARYAK